MMTEKRELIDLRKEAMGLSDQCCELRDSILRLEEEKAFMSDKELETPDGEKLTRTLEELRARRHDSMDRLNVLRSGMEADDSP